MPKSIFEDVKNLYVRNKGLIWRMFFHVVLYSLTLMLSYSGYREILKGYDHVTSHFVGDHIIDTPELPKTIRKSIKETFPGAILVITLCCLLQGYRSNKLDLHFNLKDYAVIVFFSACLLNPVFISRNEALVVLNMSFLLFFLLCALQTLMRLDSIPRYLDYGLERGSTYLEPYADPLSVLEEKIESNRWLVSLTGNFVPVLETYRVAFARFTNYVDRHRNAIPYVVVLFMLVVTLVLGFKCGFLNKHSEFSEPMYGYGSALNQVQYKSSFFIQDVSISEKMENHPYPYIHNPDLGMLLNRLIMALDIPKESSYIYANAFTAFARVVSLYLLYLLLLEITNSALFAVIAVILVGSDYNFYLTHYNALRGNTFVAYVLFLFSLVRLSRCEETKGQFYLFLSIAALWVAFLIGFMTQSTLVLTMIFLMAFGVIRISADRFAKIILFGAAAPFLFRILTVIWMVGLETWVYDNWLTQSTKVGTLSKIPRCPGQLYYIFNDANLFTGWAAYPITFRDVILDLSASFKKSLYYFVTTMDVATMVLFMVFLLWTIAYYLVSWKTGRREETFSFVSRFLVVVVLTVTLNTVVFPPYYYTFEIVYGNYIGLLAFVLPASYLLSRTIVRMTERLSGANVVLCTAIIGLFIVARVHNNHFFYQLLPVEKESMFEVLGPFKGKSATANTMKSFIYSKILERPCTFHYLNDYYMASIYCRYPGLFKFNPFPVGKSWKVNSLDQFQSYEYNFPELTIFNFNRYDLLMGDIMANTKWSFMDLFKVKDVSRTLGRYRTRTKDYVDRVLQTYGAERILYQDDDFIIVNNNPSLPPDEMLQRRRIWDKLISIQKDCFEELINLEYGKEKYLLLTKGLQSRATNETYLANENDFYTMLYNKYVEFVGSMQDSPVAREKLLNCIRELDVMGNPILFEGNMPFGHMLLTALVVNYQCNDLASVISLTERYYDFLPTQLKKYALALKILAMERGPRRDVWEYRMYKSLYGKMVNGPHPNLF